MSHTNPRSSNQGTRCRMHPGDRNSETTAEEAMCPFWSLFSKWRVCHGRGREAQDQGFDQDTFLEVEVFPKLWTHPLSEMLSRIDERIIPLTLLPPWNERVVLLSLVYPLWFLSFAIPLSLGGSTWSSQDKFLRKKSLVRTWWDNLKDMFGWCCCGRVCSLMGSWW